MLAAEHGLYTNVITPPTAEQTRRCATNAGKQPSI